MPKTTPAKRVTPSRATLPVGIKEVAEMLNVSVYTVDKWIQRGLFPERKWTVGGRPAWDFKDIAAWAKKTDRVFEGSVL